MLKLRIRSRFFFCLSIFTSLMLIVLHMETNKENMKWINGEIANNFIRKIASALLKRQKYTKSEIGSAVFSYVANISQINVDAYLLILNYTLEDYSFTKEIDIINLKSIGAGFPCLIPPELRIRYEEKWNGFSLPIITSADEGRLGNKMGEYASLLALGRLYNVTVFMHSDMRNSLISIFPHLTMPDLPENNNTDWNNVSNIPPSTVNFSPLEVASAGLFGPRLFKIIGYPFEIKLFHSLRKEILKEFTFAETYTNRANEFLLSVKNEMKMRWPTSKNFTFINFHIRRTDYLGHITLFDGVLPGEAYYQTALNYYRSKFCAPIFIASSDDKEYLAEHVKNDSDIFIVPDDDGATAMAILSACNHSIITVGSYGFWSGYLTGGEVVFPDCKCKLPYSFSKESYEEANLTFFHNLEI